MRPCISKSTKILTLGICMFLCLTCSKDDSSSEEPEEVLNLVGTWDMDTIGSFNLQMQNSARQETFVESIIIELEQAVCLETGFTQTFDYFAFANVKDNRIIHAMAGDFFAIQSGVITKWAGFLMGDLRRIDFSCDFTSFPVATGTIILSLRGAPSSSNWCEETITFTARKRE